ncbi:MAG: HNH endonuclease [Candidatus Thiodiazotropha endolucinida]
MRYNVQRKQITNSYVEGAKYLYGDAYFSYDENGQLTYVDRGRKKGAQQNSAASFTYDNQGQIIARTEQPTAAFNPDFMRGYYVDPDQAFEEDASGFYHTTLSEQARNEVFGWGNNGSGVLELRGYVHANGHQVGEASASQTIEFKRLTLQVESLQITDQANGEVTANLVDVLSGDIVTAPGGTIDTAQTARNLAQRVYAGFAALSAEAQARVVTYVQGQIQTVIDSPYFTTLTQVSLYNHIDVSDLVTGDEQLITDYAYQAIGGDEGLPGGVVSRHVVRAGESLQSIAAAYYGSPSYWYLIAEANGLDGTEELKAGTTLSIPNAVANSVNDKESYKVYSESEIIGSTSPEVRVKQKKKKWYQTLVQIIIAVIVVVAAYYVGTAARVLFAKLGPVFGALATAAVGKAAGVATSAVSQGLAIAVGLQEEFDWEAARDMGDSFALTAVAGGLTGLAGAGNTTAQVLSRGAVELGRQYIENDGKITNWSGVALKMIGTEVDPKSQWASTLSDINKNRKMLGAGLSVVEKFARGKDVNTLDWTNVAAAAISGQGGVGRYADQTSGIQWLTVAREALFVGGLSLAVGQRFGSDQAAEFFGSQLGSIATGVMGELSVIDSLNSDPFLAPDEITRAFNDTDLSAYERQQQLSGLADTRRQEVEAAVRAVAEQQQGDAVWQVDMPDELEWRNGHTTAGVFDPNSDVDTGWGSVLGGPDGVTFTEGMRAELSQTTPVTDNGVVQTYAATPYPSAEKWELLPAWGDSGLPYYSGDNLSKWLEGSNSEFTKADYLFGIASNLYDNPEDVVLQLNEAFYDSGPETYTNPVFEIAGFMDPNVDLSSMSISQQAAFMQDRFERASGHAYSAGQSYLGVEQTVLDLIVGLESSMSGRFEDKLLYDREFNNLSQVGQIAVEGGAFFNQAIEGFQGLLSLGGAILNDTGGPNGLTNRAINAVGDGLEMADFIQQDQRLVDAVVRYGKQYIPSMPVAEQGGAAIGLAGTFGTGAALKGLQAIKASENLSGLFDKFSEAVSRTQMPIGLEFQAGRLYSGIPLDAVKWKGFGQNKPISGSDLPYSSRTVRNDLASVHGTGNVSSTTIPPVNVKNVKLAGQRHPVTGIVFDNKGYPVFDDVAAFDTRLSVNPFRNAGYTGQMRMATNDLAAAIQRGEVKPSVFSQNQLRQIQARSERIDGFTWHHHQDSGRMQLVPRDIHGRTGHIGWEAMSDGK